MPGIGLAAILGLISAGVAGTETGLQLSGAGQPSPGELQKEQQQQQLTIEENSRKQQEEANKQAYLKARPNAQEASSGFLAPASFADFVNRLAGSPGSSGEAASALGINISGGTEGAPSNASGKGLTDALKYLFPGDASEPSLTTPLGQGG